MTKRMKTISPLLIALMIGSFTLSSTTWASPDREDDTPAYEQKQGKGGHKGGKKAEQRIKQHRWQTGYILPQHYRSDAYKMDYRQANLTKPNRNQQWFLVNEDYILVDTDKHQILHVEENKGKSE